MVEVAGQIQIASPRQIEGHHHFIPPNREMQAIASQPPQQAHQHNHNRRLPPMQGRFGRAGAARRPRLSGRSGLRYFIQQGRAPNQETHFAQVDTYALSATRTTIPSSDYSGWGRKQVYRANKSASQECLMTPVLSVISKCAVFTQAVRNLCFDFLYAVGLGELIQLPSSCQSLTSL